MKRSKSVTKIKKKIRRFIFELEVFESSLVEYRNFLRKHNGDPYSLYSRNIRTRWKKIIHRWGHVQHEYDVTAQFALDVNSLLVLVQSLPVEYSLKYIKFNEWLESKLEIMKFNKQKVSERIKLMHNVLSSYTHYLKFNADKGANSIAAKRRIAKLGKYRSFLKSPVTKGKGVVIRKLSQTTYSSLLESFERECYTLRQKVLKDVNSLYVHYSRSKSKSKIDVTKSLTRKIDEDAHLQRIIYDNRIVRKSILDSIPKESVSMDRFRVHLDHEDDVKKSMMESDLDISCESVGVMNSSLNFFKSDLRIPKSTLM